MTHFLTTPISDEALQNIKIGDTVYLDGLIMTGRDSAHKRCLSGTELPFDMAGAGIFHAGPIVDTVDDAHSVVAAGPTTSMRMEKFQYDFIEKTGVKLIIGKGGMGEKTAEACKKFKALHTLYPGGCGVLAADSVQEVIDVQWLDLGMPEALWLFRVKNFGPLIVTIDAEGNNLFEYNKTVFKQRKDRAFENLCEKLFA